MQFLASFHIVLTCSFVVLLAYLLSRVFTYLAHSVIHGSDAPRRRTEGSSRSRRSGSLKPLVEQEEDYHGGAMARLQEEVEEADDNTAAYEDAVQVRMAVPAALKYGMAGSIFDDEIHQEYEVRRDVDVRAGAWDSEEGLGGAIGGDTTALEYKDNEDGGKMKGDAGGEELLEKEEEKGGGDRSVLGDAQGSGSLQQRLPPTWSDLERMVNLSSMKHSSPPSSVSPVPEY